MAKKCGSGFKKKGNRCVRNKSNSRGCPIELSSGGSGFLGLLALLFIALKLIGVPPVSNWDWWLVLVPLWVPIVLIIIILIIINIRK